MGRPVSSLCYSLTVVVIVVIDIVVIDIVDAQRLGHVFGQLLMGVTISWVTHLTSPW